MPRLRRVPSGAWLEVEAGFRAPGFYGDVVGFGCADGDFVAGEIGNAGEGETHLLVESGGGFIELVEPVFEGAGLFHERGRVLARFLECAHLLAEFVAAGLELLCLCDGFAAALIEGAKIAQQDAGVGAPRTQFFFHLFQVGTDKIQVEHCY